MNPSDQELLAETPVTIITLEVCEHGCRYTKRDGSGRFVRSAGQHVGTDILLQWLTTDLTGAKPTHAERLRRVHLYCDPLTSEISGEYDSLHTALRLAPLVHGARACPKLMSNGEILGFPFHYGWALTAQGINRLEAEYLARVKS